MTPKADPVLRGIFDFWSLFCGWQPNRIEVFESEKSERLHPRQECKIVCRITEGSLDVRSVVCDFVSKFSCSFGNSQAISLEQNNRFHNYSLAVYEIIILDY